MATEQAFFEITREIENLRTYWLDAVDSAIFLDVLCGYFAYIQTQAKHLARMVCEDGCASVAIERLFSTIDDGRKYIQKVCSAVRLVHDAKRLCYAYAKRGDVGTLCDIFELYERAQELPQSVWRHIYPSRAMQSVYDIVTFGDNARIVEAQRMGGGGKGPREYGCRGG